LPYRWTLPSPPDISWGRGWLDLSVKPVSVRTPHLTVAGRYPERCPQQRENFLSRAGVRTFLPSRTCSGERGLDCLGSEMNFNKFA